MKTSRLFTLFVLAVVNLFTPGCGLNKDYLVAVQIAPSAGTATAGTSSDTVQFKATGWYATVNCGQYGSCYTDPPDRHQPLANASWVTSDPVNTKIDAAGLATCVSPTSLPATITATGQGGYYGPIKGTGTLICN
jgi:hypothetical protein